jgi:hypothetical protein
MLSWVANLICGLLRGFCIYRFFFSYRRPLVPNTIVVHVPPAQPYYPPPLVLDPSKKAALDNLSASLANGEISQVQYAQAVAALG